MFPESFTLETCIESKDNSRYIRKRDFLSENTYYFGLSRSSCSIISSFNLASSLPNLFFCPSVSP